MRTFPDDDLDPAQVGGDLVVQLSAGHGDTVLHALRDITRHTRGGMQISWRMDGFDQPGPPVRHRSAQPFRVHGRHRQPGRDRCGHDEEAGLGGREPSGEPAWTAGGSYFVVRLIRMLVEFWDRVAITEQENDDRAAPGHRGPAGRRTRSATPGLRLDPSGDGDPADRAHPAGQPADRRRPRDSRILRRGYNYDRGIDSVGNLDMGLIFTCYQQDLERQFEAVQTRLIGEPLVDYITPVRRRLLLRPARASGTAPTTSAAALLA